MNAIFRENLVYAPGDPKGTTTGDKGTPKDGHKDGQREPRAPQRETKGAKSIPKGDKGSPRAPGAVEVGLRVALHDTVSAQSAGEFMVAQITFS